VTPEALSIVIALIMVIGAALWAVQARYCPDCAHCRAARLQEQQAKDKRAHDSLHTWYPMIRRGDTDRCPRCKRNEP
jgi:hypothetical protein